MRFRLSLLLLFIIVLPTFQTCRPRYYVLMETGEMYINSYGVDNDMISMPFTVIIRFDHMTLGANNFFINTAQAFKRTINFLNHIDPQSIELCLDRPCTIGGESYEAGENIIANFYPDNLSVSGDYVQITFDEEKLRIIEFEKGSTTFLLNGKNSDSIRFEFNKTVFMNL